MAQTATIVTDLKVAMKAKDQLKVSVLRMVLSALKNEEIAKRKELEEAEVGAILSKEVKKRVEAIELYKQGNRQELADRETAEIEIIKTYLPALMDQAELETIILKIKAEGEWQADFGQAMRLVMAQVRGRADGKMVAEAVKKNL